MKTYKRRDGSKRRDAKDGGRAGRVTKLSRLVVYLCAAMNPWRWGSVERMRSAVKIAFADKARAAGVSEHHLDELIKSLLVWDVAPGTAIIVPGDKPPFLTVTGVGAVKTVIPEAIYDPKDEQRRPVTVQCAGPGRIVGIAPTLHGQTEAKFAAVAHVRSVMVAVSRDVMIRHVLEPAPAEAKLQMIAYSCRAISRLIHDKCCLLSLRIVSDKVMRVMAQLAGEHPQSGRPGLIRHVFTHQDIAEMIGCTREAVWRALKDLRPRVSRIGRRYLVAPDLMAEPPRTHGTRTTSPGYPCDVDVRARLKRTFGAGRVLGLPKRIVATLIEHAELREYDAEDTIATSDPFRVMILLSGTARVMVDTAPNESVGVWIAKPGHFIGAGWMGTAGHPAPAFYAVAHEPAVVASLNATLMVQLIDAMTSEEVMDFLGYCTDVLSSQLHHRTVMLPMSTTERVLYQVHVLATEFPTPHPRGTIVAIPLEREHIAALVATDIGGLRKSIRDLEDADRIRILSDGRILVVGYFTTYSAA